MEKTYTITSELGSLTTPIAKEALKLALRNRVNQILVTYENGVKYTHTMKQSGLIVIREMNLEANLKDFETNFLFLVSSSNR